MSKDFSLLPVLPSPTLHSRRTAISETGLQRFDAAIVLHAQRGDLGKTDLPLATSLAVIAKRQDDAALVTATMGGPRATQLIAVRAQASDDVFARDTACRKAAKLAIDAGATNIAVVVDRESIASHQPIVQSMVATLTLAGFRLPKIGARKPPKPRTLTISVYEPAKTPLTTTIADVRGNCLARWLTAMPPNLLDARGYRTLAKALAEQYGWQYRFHSTSALKRKGAGAFVAVAQGNEHDDAGIIQLTARGSGKRKTRRHAALVGKGILFDTGGTNLKPADGMLDMHTDMGGSAVALGTLLALTENGTDIDLDVWLAVTENRTGPQAYKQQDLVTALNGQTIQVIHTDAEGRMVLADTLALAAQRKPDVIIDFATLTGACVNAVTTRYSGIFSNRAALHPLLKRAGSESGERVWPFPIGGDFNDALKSDTADIMQCTVSGGGDHILAATFLETFVPKYTPWIHVDLSACEHKGGLGAVTTKITGFGVRFASLLLREHHDELKTAKRNS